MMPAEIATQFLGEVTPGADAVFSPLQISRSINESRLPVNPQIEFANPVGKLYATFSYNNMQDGVQWTALWYRLQDRKLICYETQAWAGGTGGYGYTECEPLSNEWLPGEFEVQIFLGMQWQVSGRFTITGNPPTPAPTLTPTSTRTSTITPGPSPTRTASRTPQPSSTPTITRTPRPSATLTVTSTRAPTWTASPTRPTNTRAPSPTATR